MKTNSNIFKKNKSKGFTLIEVVVVLLILSILSGIAVPALTGYIGDSKKRTMVFECRSCVVAANTLSVRAYGDGAPIGNITYTDDPFIQKVLILAEVPKDGVIDSMTYVNSEVSELYYTRDGITVRYYNGEYSVVDGMGPVDPGSETVGGTLPEPAKPNFTDVGTLHGTERTDAIKNNAIALLGIFNQCLSEALNEVSPDAKIVYWNKPSGGILDNFGLCTLYESNYNQVVKEVSVKSGDLIKPILEEYGIDGRNVKVVFENTTKNSAGKTLRNVTPSRIEFKAKSLTGGTSDTYYYNYYPESGELVQEKKAVV